jgi:hypothetical protein
MSGPRIKGVHPVTKPVFFRSPARHLATKFHSRAKYPRLRSHLRHPIFASYSNLERPSLPCLHVARIRRPGRPSKRIFGVKRASARAYRITGMRGTSRSRNRANPRLPGGHQSPVKPSRAPSNQESWATRQIERQSGFSFAPRISRDLRKVVVLPGLT